MSNDSQREDPRTLTSGDLPESPAEATDLAQFDIEALTRLLDEAHEDLYSYVESEHNTDADSRRLEITFRSYNPVNAGTGVHDYHQLPGGEWMQYNCVFTGMPVAVRKGAPVPVVALYETSSSGREALVECYKFHPDFLKNRHRLFQMLVGKFVDDVFAGVYEARKALSALHFLSDLEDVPGRPTEEVTYPGGEGYEPIGGRPILDENEDE